MIYIVRHGQTNFNLEKRITGRIDIPLNEYGKEEALLLKEKLKGIHFDYVFSSPLKRAIETAKIISDNEIIIDKRLIERFNGDIEGKLKKELPTDFDYNSLSYHLETYEEIQKRVYSFLNEMRKKYHNKNILVVTHGGVIIQMRCYLEGNPEDGNIDKYVSQNCEVLKYEN